MKNLVPQFIIQNDKSGVRQGNLSACTMFLDMSGFSGLTQKLVKEEGNEGAELMSKILNNIFNPLVDKVYQRGGMIPYFAGDAFTSIFPECKRPEKIISLAIGIQKLFEEGANTIVDGEEFPVRLKIGLSIGDVNWGIIGNEGSKSYYFKGHAIDNCAKSEQKASEGQVIIDESLYQEIDKSQFEFEEILPGYYRVLGSADDQEEVFQSQESREEIGSLSEFVPDSIIRYNDIGEFRNVVSVFIKFEGIPDREAMDEFSTVIATEYSNFKGYFKEIDFGDKGGVFVGFFGAPITYGDNINRGLEFILTIREKLTPVQEKYPLVYKAGITSGMAYTGIIGSDNRCQYACVGTSVNLAARLMVFAEWGDVLVDRNIQKEKGFLFRFKGDIVYKGFDAPISTYTFEGRSMSLQSFFSGKMVGRERELEEMQSFIEPIFDDTFAGVVVVFGEAGIGKSRLAFELRSRMKEQYEMDWLICQADQILQKPFNPFIYLLKNIFEQSPDNTHEGNREAFENTFAALLEKCRDKIDSDPMLLEVSKELIRTKSVIAARIGLETHDSLWNQLDAKGRYQNTISSFINVLKALASLRPFVLEVEDGHWFDPSTKALLSELVEVMRHYSACIIITSRYKEEDLSKPDFFETPPPEEMPYLEIDLNILSPEAIREFAEVRLEGTIAQGLQSFLMKSTNGNPFYTEQMLEYLVENDWVFQKNEAWNLKAGSDVKITDSINAVLMARIDRLSHLVKETVKAAAVIGREFELQILTEVMRQQHEFQKRNGDYKHLLQEQVDSAEKGQIWKAVNELRYMFKHSLLREAVYDMQLRTRLRELHRLIAEAIEHLFTGNLSEHFAELAFHYEHAGLREKTNFYLEKAADYYKRNFQNQAAIRYYDQLAESLDRINEQSDYIKTLLKKADILEQIGDWAECERILQNALALAGSSSDRILLGRANNDLGNLLTMKGEYEEALKYLKIAAMFFEDVEDDIGKFKVYGNLGNVYFRQGQYEKAKDYYIESLALSESTGNTKNDFPIVSNLGLAHMNQGQYEEAINHMEPKLRQCVKEGNKQGIANISIYLGIVYFEKGDYENALSCYQQGLREAESLGNKFLTAIALGVMGNLKVREGEFETAASLYKRDLELVRDIGDKQGTAITLGLIGDLNIERGLFDEALGYLEEQLQLSRELNYQKGIASALGSIGDVHLHNKSFEKAGEVYNEAITICEEMENKRLLILALFRKVELMMEAGHPPQEILKTSEWSDRLADEIGNEELIFKTSVQRAKVELRYADTDLAMNELNSLLANAENEEMMADALFAMSRVDTAESELHRTEALELYKELFKKSPKYKYKARMDLLNK